ncbi:unnamed protein product [Owenia fusiformis]|uniref:Uncharacterized protein n=1 Tax=Owenia fusiformis TaxID=6347 RepID=A0A8S4PEJ9_OWEFU|nr:unnamed protein product [Owenia fusiformis]
MLALSVFIISCFPVNGFLEENMVSGIATQHENYVPLKTIPEIEKSEATSDATLHNDLIQGESHQIAFGNENNGALSKATDTSAGSNHHGPDGHKFKCKFEIPTESQKRFIELTDKEKKNFIYVHLNFSTKPKLPSRRARESLFFPGYLTWTFKGRPGAGYPLLSYPYNYDTLSLGFLYWHVRENFTMNVKVKPKGCNSTWGEHSMMLSLLYTVRNLSAKIEYNNSAVWCYSLRYKPSKFEKWLNHVTGVNRNSNGFQCSEPEHPHKYGEEIRQTRLLLVLQVIGCVLFSYAPLLLYMFDEGRTYSSSLAPEKDMKMGYEHLDGSVEGGDKDDAANGKEVGEDEASGEYLYLGEDAPITFFSLLKTMFVSTTRSNSVTVQRIKKGLSILLLTPSLIVLDTAITFMYKHKALYIRIMSDVPIGFHAIPFGYELSSRNWLYFLGGPYVIYSVYFFLAILLVCLPVNLCEVVALQIEKNDKSGCMLFMTSDIIENLGGVKYSKLPVSYKKLSKAFTARLYTLLHYKFWVLLKNVWIKRIKAVRCKFGGPFRGSLKKCVCFTIFLPVWLVLFVLFVLDIVCCIAYFGVPIVFFIKTVVQNYIRYVLDRFLYTDKRGQFLARDSVCCGITAWIIRIILFVVFAFVFFCAITMYTVSVVFVTNTFAFTIIGIIAFPEEAVMYCIGTGIVIMYIYKTVRGFNDGYNDLLLYTITLSDDLNTQQKTRSTDKEPVKYIIHQSDGSEISGVPAHVYYSLVESFRPLRRQVFLTLIYLGLIAAFMYVCIHVIQSYNREAQLSVLVKTVATVIAGILPHLVQLCWGSVNQDAKNMRYKLQIKSNIKAHWQRHKQNIQDEELIIN